MSSYSIVLNSSNVVGTGNNTFKYNFIGGSFTVPEGSEISLKSITVPYSWFNISKALGNNYFQYSLITTGTTSVAYDVLLADGFYDITALNNALWGVMKTNLHYFYNDSIVNGVSFPKLIFPICFSSNYNGYNNAVSLDYIPISAPAVITLYGTGYHWALNTYPTDTTAPQLIIPAGVSSTSQLFGNIIGFTAGTYPATISSYPSATPSTVFNSQPLTILGNSLSAFPPFPPLATIINSINVRCNLIDNSVAMPSDIFDSFPINATFGSNINYQAQIDNFVKMKSGKQQNMIISLCDQNFNPIVALDPNVLISILIKTGK